MQSNLEDAVRELSTYFESALPLYYDTVRCLEEMKSEAKLSEEAKAEMFSPVEIEEIGRLLKKRPSVVFIGNRNCGKSAVLNELLRGSYLPVHETPCTSRIVKISHSSGNNSIKVVNKAGKELRPLVNFSGKSKTVREYIVVPAQRREDKEELSATVEIKLNHPLLQSGIELIDSPGRNENDALNDIVDGFFEEGSTPLVVYIIDGNEQLRPADREAIRLLQDKCPHMSFIFVCNKVDVSTAAQQYDHSDSSDEDEDTADKRDKQRTVFLQLQRYGFLPENETLNSCRNFHGISALNVRCERKKTMKGKTATATFAGFEQCLLEILHQTLKRQTRQAAEKVLSMLLRFIAALDVEKKVLARRINPEFIMTIIVRLEKSILEKILTVILVREKELKSIVKRCLINLETYCVHQAHHFNPETAICSSREMEALATTMSRLVTRWNVSSQTDGTHTRTLQFLAFIKGIILDKAFNTLRCEVNAYLTSIIAILQEIKHSLNMKDSFLIELAPTIFAGRSVLLLDQLTNFVSAALREKLSRALEEGICRLCNEEGLMSLDKVHGKITGKEARATVVRRILLNLREEGITNTITEACKALMNRTFLQLIAVLQAMCKVMSRMSQRNLKELATLYVPRVKCLALRGYAMCFSLSQGSPTLGPLLLGKVHSCTGWSKDPCVVKIVEKNKVGADVWEQTAGDLIHGWHIQNALDPICPNLLRLYGWLTPQPETLHIVMERAHLSLSSTLQSGLLRKMNSRAKIALGIANGINKIHQAGVVERDLKADSILVSRDGTAKINLAKAEKPFETTSQGIPFHISKEMYANYGNGLGSSFSYDIYAFGMLLWVLCEGSGTRRPKVYEPYDTIEKMKIAVENDLFPERPNGTPDTWWNLMTKCWKKREDLTSEDVLAEMRKIVEES